MSRRSPVEIAVRDWIVAALGIPVLYADQDLSAAPRELGTYATVAIPSDVGLGSTLHEEQTDTPGDDDPDKYKLDRSQQRQGVARITVYGDGAAVATRDLEFAHKRDTVRSVIKAGGLAIGSRLSRTDTTAIQSTSAQRRSQIDIAFRWIRSEVEERDTFDTFDLTTTAE